MSTLKVGVLVSGLLGIVGCFLPLSSAGGPSLWALRSMTPGLAMMVISAFLVAAIVGAVGMARPPMLRWQGILAILGFGFVLAKLREVITTFITDGAIGARMIGIGAVVGLVLAVLCTVKAEPAREPS
jgi:hypothetical protein